MSTRYLLFSIIPLFDRRGKARPAFAQTSQRPDRTDRSLMLAWPSAIRPIAAVEHLLFRPFRLRSRSAYQGRSSRPRPFGVAALRLVFGTDNCINAISAPKNGSSTAAIWQFLLRVGRKRILHVIVENVHYRYSCRAGAANPPPVHRQRINR